MLPILSLIHNYIALLAKDTDMIDLTIGNSPIETISTLERLTTSCPSINYAVSVSNCDMCPMSASHMTITCSADTTDKDICTVQLTAYFCQTKLTSWRREYNTTTHHGI